MRIAILGATGNLGTALLERCARDDRISDIVALARRSPRRSWPKTEFQPFDLTRDDLTPLLEGVDALVHFAWIFQPTHRPTETWRTNVIGTGRVFEAVARSSLSSVVYASSIGAYRPAHGRLVDEQWPTDGLPTAGYGREKAYAERLCDVLEARRPDLRLVRLRPGFVFQASAASEQRRLFGGPLTPSALLRPGVLPVLPVPKGLEFQALHADDLASAALAGLVGDARGPFNLAAEPVIDATRLGEVLGARPLVVPAVLARIAVAAAFGLRLVPVEPALLDLALGLPRMRTDRAREVLGWQPRVSATDALREALSAMARGRGGPSAPLRPDSPMQRLDELAGGVAERQMH